MWGSYWISIQVIIGLPFDSTIYSWRDAVVSVTEDDLRIWREQPGATFELKSAGTMVEPNRYILGMASYEQ